MWVNISNKAPPGFLGDSDAGAFSSSGFALPSLGHTRPAVMKTVAIWWLSPKQRHPWHCIQVCTGSSWARVNWTMRVFAIAVTRW